MQKILDVRIGEVKVAKKGETLRAILGSCVGLGVVWKEKKVCGLAHCLLPESPTPTFAIGARFVDQAFRSLIALLKIRDDRVKEIQLIIVGGGNMTHPGIEDSLVGSSNFSTALEQAKKFGFNVAHSDGGGEEGRKIIIDSLNFSYRIEKIPRINESA